MWRVQKEARITLTLYYCQLSDILTIKLFLRERERENRKKKDREREKENERKTIIKYFFVKKNLLNA